MRFVPSVSAVLFDWDGTLADSFATTRPCLAFGIRALRIRMNEARYQATYRPDWHETYRQLGIPETRWDEAGTIWREKYLERSHAVNLFPDVLGALRALTDRELRLGVVTSADRLRLREDLDRLALADRFEALVAFEDTRNKKPHPEGSCSPFPASALNRGTRSTWETGRKTSPWGKGPAPLLPPS